jgi:hypothetical protein
MANRFSVGVGRFRRIGAGFVAFAFLAVGCSGGGTTTTSSGPTTTSTTPPATTVTSGPATTADPAIVAKAMTAVLQTGDFPYGYQAQPPDPNGNLQVDVLWGDMTHCLGLPGPLAGHVAYSPTYKLGLATQAVSAVEYTTSSATAAIAAAVGGSAFMGCATAAFNANAKRVAPQGATPGPAALSPLNVAPVGDKMFAFRVNITQNLSDLQVPIFQDFYVIINGVTVSRLWFLQPGSPFPPDLEQSLVQKVVTRAGKGP